MSAWLVSELHLNLIVNASAAPSPELFAMLVAENVRSLRARYGEGAQEDADIAETYRFKPEKPRAIVERAFALARKEGERYAEGYPAILTKPTPATIKAQIAKALDCYDYQACESDDYQTTPAAEWIRQMQERYPTKRGVLYDSCLWGL